VRVPGDERMVVPTGGDGTVVGHVWDAATDSWSTTPAATVPLELVGDSRLKARVRTDAGECTLDLVNGWIGDLVAGPSIDPDGTIRVTPRQPYGNTVAGQPVVLGTIACNRPADAAAVVAALTPCPRDS